MSEVVVRCKSDVYEVQELNSHDLAIEVIKRAIKDLEETKNIISLPYYLRMRKNKEFAIASNAQKIQMIQEWFYDDSEEEKTFLYWLSYLTERPKELQKIIIESFGIQPPGDPIVLPKMHGGSGGRWQKAL